MTREKVSAVILAGGKSSRLGTDKSLTTFKNRRLLDIALELLKSLGLETTVIGPPKAVCDSCAVFLEDEEPGLGPIGGIITAFKAIKRPLLVLSCDMPLMSPKLLEKLLLVRNEDDSGKLMTVYRHPDTGFVESLAAIYELSALEVLVEAKNRGQRKLSAAITEEHRLHIPIARGEKDCFFNLNTPDDLRFLGDLETKTAADAPGTH